MNKPKILIFTDVYLPGVKGGGPIKTISSLVSKLCSNFDFYIFTNDRDLGDKIPYPNIQVNSWVKQGYLNVFYYDANTSKKTFVDILNDVNYDLIYLNSFFNYKFTIIPLLMMKFGKMKKKPVLLAPRGELSTAALLIKKNKKNIFTKIASVLGLYNNITFQASSIYEELDIKKFCNKYKIKESGVFICENLSNLVISREKEFNTSDVLKICYLSRISRMKNLKFAIDVLAKLTIPVEFSIYGPLEDLEYWFECQKSIQRLPDNVKVIRFDTVGNDKVQQTIQNYDLFFVPTLGENYGHVFIEAFASGTPVLVSDQTPWRNLKKLGIGWDLPLNIESFVETVYTYYSLDLQTKQKMSAECLKFADEKINDLEKVETTKQLFLTCLKEK